MRTNPGKHFKALLLALSVTAGPAMAEQTAPALLLHAARVFDGATLKTGTSVLIIDDKIARIDKREAFKNSTAKAIDLGDATLLPGFIELHAHTRYKNIPGDTVLKHGITTLRDLGGPVFQPEGGNGSLRRLSSGLIITAVGGYPIVSMGAANLAVAVSNETDARAAVRQQVNDGAVIIKIALEPGGESGAPWSNEHGHEHHTPANNTGEHPQHAAQSHSTKPWPLLPLNTVKAIVAEAHRLQRRVSAHISESKCAAIALDAGVDEWAHTPCEKLNDKLLKQAAAQQVTIISTLDTLSKCSGAIDNARRFAAFGGKIFYGAELAHRDIPWGIDAQELQYLQQVTHLPALAVLAKATHDAGRYLGFPLLGSLLVGAPADLIAVHGDPTINFKLLEYPDLVISGGKIVTNNFAQ